MKKILLFIFIICSSLILLASCGKEKHVHNFEFNYEETATCKREAAKYYKCSCGETKRDVVSDKVDHDFVYTKTIDPTCLSDGRKVFTCSMCKKEQSEYIKATGHNFGAAPEASRLAPCNNKGCSYGQLAEGNGKYKDVLVYKFNDADKDNIKALYDEVKAHLDAADKYNPDLHGYATGTDLETAYLEFEALYEEYYDMLEYVVSQYQLAQIEYHIDLDNEEKEEIFSVISEYRTAAVADFYSFSSPIYDSLYREFYYEGMTQEEIDAFLFESDAVSNPEFVELKDANSAIEIEFNELNDPTAGSKVPELYAKFVENNKKIAELLGYDNYLEYAYESVYDRDYTYQDSQQFAKYVKQYLSKVFLMLYDKYQSTGGSLNDKEYDEYIGYASNSFFNNVEANTLLNDYIDLMAFTSNPDKQISFSDEFNKLMSDGNMFYGQYEGAYVTRIYGTDPAIPIAYFSEGYDTPFTVVHEFGHFMNEVYNTGDESQSYDLLEMHSQGNEMLYLAFLEGKLSGKGFETSKYYQLVNLTYTIIAALCVDTFEQAVYLDSYTGTDSATIMADGKITSDEYDALYASILKDFGVESQMSSSYWRYMTISSPCYYVSYSVSALSVLQLYSTASSGDFEGAKASYLKLFTYIDENPEMTIEEILEYAGMYSFTDEELYKNISNYLS